MDPDLRPAPAETSAERVDVNEPEPVRPGRRRFPLVSVLVSAAYLAGLVAFGDPIIKSNDNAAIVSDLHAGTAVKYVGFAWQTTLGWLYRSVSEGFPWYGLALYAVHLVSLVLLLEALRLVVGRRWLWWGLTLVYLLSYAPLVIEVGFNSASMMLGSNAILFFLALRSRALAASVGLALLLFLSFQVRALGPLLPLPFLLPLAFLPWPGKPGFRGPALAVSLVLGLVLADRVAFHLTLDEANRTYLEHLALRGHFHGYPILPANVGNEELLAANGWTANDYELLRAFFILHEEKFGMEEYENIREHSVPLYSWTGSTGDGLGVLRRNRFELALLAAFAILAAAIGGRRSAGLALLYAAYCATGVYLMGEFLRYPVRVAAPTNLAFQSGGLLWILASRRSELLGKRRLVAALVSLSLAAWAVLEAEGEARYRLKKSRRETAELARDLETLDALGSEAVLLFFAGTSGKGRLHPLKMQEPRPHCIYTGWNTFSPDFYASLEPLGVSRGSQLLPAMIDRPLAFVVHRYEQRELLEIFMSETYGLECRLAAKRELENGSIVSTLRSTR